MGICVGTRLGPYEIIGALGAGAMGEVYRARDDRLERDVAIKVIPDALALDADRLARFRREAQILASLNHPNIAAVYGLEHEDGRQALVLELVEGVTLADRIADRRIAIDEALAIARQIAEALEAAHERGIVHRDLKPANIMVTRDGMVKVLDFGLARTPSASASADAAPIQGTRAGALMGTPQYMSPEQALGEPADRSSDVWAFGCVLYEMLTGQCAFEGKAAADVLAAVLRTEPDWRQLPRPVPPAIRRLLRRSLRKKQHERLRDIRSARLEIDEALGAVPSDADAPPQPSRGIERAIWGSALAAVALGAGILGVSEWRLAPAPETRLEINTPPTRDPSIALSPDGRRIAFIAESQGLPHLWVRSLEETRANVLPGTAGATNPFWSADGRSIAFFSGTRLMRIDPDGRSRATIRNSELPMGGAWNAEDTIILSTRPGLPLQRVAADGGGESSPVTGFDSGHDGYFAPQFLPDGLHFVFLATGRPDVRGIHVGQLDRTETRRLFDGDSNTVAYTSTGHLLFTRNDSLLAQRLDAESLALIGEPIIVADGVGHGATLTASPAGPIAYRTLLADTDLRQLVWVDRDGRELERVTYPDGSAFGPGISPDGRYVGVFRQQNDNMDLWTYDRQRGLWDRLTVGADHEIYALWSADGTRLVFASNRNGRLDLFSKPTSLPPGEGEELLLATPETKWPMDLRSDGRFVLYTSLNPDTSADIWALPLEGERVPFEVVRTEFYEQHPQFSPDGDWIAYQSDPTGRNEIYMRRFPGPGPDTRISSSGGGQPRFSPDGSELFYVAADDWLMAIQIRADSDSGTLELGTPERLFLTNIGSTAPNTNRHQYAVTPDGRAFVLNSVVDDAAVSPITVILNWSPDR